MSPENSKQKYTKDGVIKLAEFDLSLAKRAEAGEKADDRLKAAQATLDLKRLEGIAKKKHYKLPEEILADIMELKLRHPNPAMEAREELGFKKPKKITPDNE